MVNIIAAEITGVLGGLQWLQLLGTPCSPRVQVGSRVMSEGVAVAIRCLLPVVSLTSRSCL